MNVGFRILDFRFRTLRAVSFRIAVACAVCLVAISSLGAQASLQSQSADQALSLYTRGRQLQIQGREAEAQKAFAASLEAVQAILKAEPSRKDVVYLLCWNLFRLGRHKDVVAAAEKTLASGPDYRISETMAESLYFLGRTEEALAQFSVYVHAAPQGDERYSSAYYYIGECYMRLKKFEHADIAFSTAVALEKGMYYWWYRLGSVQEILTQYRRAYASFGKALELNPGFKFAQEGRARVKAKAGL
ncbi:MAG TPA: tetratricopeptide repeat protein [Rectinemataceae bacterium]